MASDISEKRNYVLSQSYIQGVERVAQRSINDDADFSFNLPKEVLQEREKAWCSFFQKYTDDVADDVELNIQTMKPVEGVEANADDNENGNDREDEKQEGEGEYYSKCRAPIRKLPALIQYWVDTGNPPYQLGGGGDDSETGSSLSEGECWASGKSAVIRGSVQDVRIDDENSPCSSVDTAAYVLANANITERGRTLEITEGAKSDANESNPQESAMTPPITGNDALPRSPGREASSISEINQRDSLTLSEVLPALQQFDELMEMSKLRETSDGNHVPKSNTPVVVENPREIITRARQSFQESLAARRFSNLTTMTNRRKLYTGRNSPIDLIPVRQSTNGSATPTTTFAPKLSHPALEPIVETRRSFANRASARRKRKRASMRIRRTNDATALITRDADENNTRVTRASVAESKNDSNNNKNVERTNEGHERYANFFESLGLTPSRSVVERTDGGVSENARGETSEGQSRAKDDFKEKKDSSTREDDPEVPPRRPNDLLGDRMLTVRLVRLSEEKLARYRKSSEIPRSLPEITSSGGKKPLEKSSNIELLTTMTHDSDSSTILICSCNGNNSAKSGETSNDDTDISAQLPTEDVAAGPKLEAKNVEDSIKQRHLAVTLVKLPRGERRKLKASTRQRRTFDDPRVESSSDNSAMTVSGCDSPEAKSVDRADSYFPPRRKNAERGATIASRTFEKSRKMAASIVGTESRKLTSRFGSAHNRFPVVSQVEKEKKPDDEEDDDDDDDDFTRLVQKVATRRLADAEGRERSSNSSRIRRETEHNLARPRRSRGFLKIAPSSDEDDPPVSRRGAGAVTRGKLARQRTSRVLGGEDRLRDVEPVLPKNLFDEIPKSGRDESCPKRETNGRVLRRTRNDATAAKPTRTKNEVPMRFQTRLDSDSDSDFEKRSSAAGKSTRNNEFEVRTDVFSLSGDPGTNLEEESTMKRGRKNPSSGVGSIARENDAAKKMDFSESPGVEKPQGEPHRGAGKRATRRKERTTSRTFLEGKLKHDESDDEENPPDSPNSAERPERLCFESDEVLKRSRDGNADVSDDEMPARRKKRKDVEARNIFLDIDEDTMEKLDVFMFSDDYRSPDIVRNADAKKVHPETPKIRKNLMKPRRSTTMTFRTKLIDDSDDDDDGNHAGRRFG